MECWWAPRSPTSTTRTTWWLPLKTPSCRGSSAISRGKSTCTRSQERYSFPSIASYTLSRSYRDVTPKNSIDSSSLTYWNPWLSGRCRSTYTYCCDSEQMITQTLTWCSSWTTTYTRRMTTNLTTSTSWSWCLTCSSMKYTHKSSAHTATPSIIIPNNLRMASD